eukprot:Skav230810  [mRNA]  locus=scaffold851:162374:163768:+ [translate_table: standard]
MTCLFTLLCAFLARRRRSRSTTKHAPRKVVSNDSITVVNDEDSISNCQVVRKAGPSQVPSRDIVGCFIIGAGALPPLQALPVFIDMKIAADPQLPGLTDSTLPIASTAYFIGWLVGAMIIERMLAVFSQKQLVVLHGVALLLLTLANVVVPYLTAGNLVIYTCIRFLFGLQMNITALQCMYMQERLPPSLGNQVLVANSILYCFVMIGMAWSCSGLTLTLDWRIEALFWYSIFLILGIGVGFPDWRDVVGSIPSAVFQKGKATAQVTEVESGGCSNEGGPPMTLTDKRNIIAMAVTFLACGCCFYGLTFSAGRLSPDVYKSSMLLHAGDIAGYSLALTADKYGRNNVQALAFFVAAVCLLVCSTGEPGGPWVLPAATLGRLCVDVCFTTIYVCLAQIFGVGKVANVAFMVCETTARIGGILAPLSGTCPVSMSCPLFASLCLAAACCTMTLPKGAKEANEGDSL